MNLYWGDLHNHCSVSYGNGTPERALANARRHLDFCTITGHAFWPDMPMDLASQNAIIGMHLGGFAKLQYYWRDLLKQMSAACIPGEFVTFPSYEWHSMAYGDHNCYFRDFEPELLDARDPAALAERLHARGRDFMMLPHHCAYVRGFRGVNWDHFDAGRSPLVEIFSNHGAGEADDAPYEYHHSMGPRAGESTVRAGLVAGHRFGFYASTDSHDGYPGHYGHGVVGVLAERLDQESIWRALAARRTVASTGARIRPDVRLGGAGIGEVTRSAAAMPLSIRIEGTAPIQQVDLVEGSAGQWRLRRLGGPGLASEFKPGRHKIKIECGWGRGSATSDWRIRAEVREGVLLGADPCFRYSAYRPGETEPTEKLHCKGDAAEWTCRAAANPAGIMGGTHFNAGGTQSVVLDVEAGASTVLRVNSGDVVLEAAVSDLVRGSIAQQAAGFGSAALKVHRAVPADEFTFQHEEATFRPAFPGAGFLYVRVLQSDGQAAWISPIWYD